MLVLNTLAPVFLLIALGALLLRVKFVTAEFLREANRLTYWLGLPALLFSQLASAFRQVGGASRMFLVMLLATLAGVLVAYVAAYFLRVRSAAVGSFVQGAFRGNLAFIGLPIMFSLPPVALAGGLTPRSAALIIVAPTMVVYNVVAVVVLLLSHHRFGFAMIRPFLRQLATTPPLLGSVAGMVFALAGWRVPGPVDKALAALGEMALPLGLLGVGGALASVRLGAEWRLPLWAALLKTVGTPALGCALGWGLGLPPPELKTVLILLACPTAVVSYTMALQLRGDEPIAAGAITLSTVTSLLALGAIVGWL